MQRKTGRRIVNTGEYNANVEKKVFKIVGRLFVFAVLLVIIFYASLFCFDMATSAFMRIFDLRVFDFCILITWAFIAGTVDLMCLRFLRTDWIELRESLKMEVGITRERATATDLPAPDSLVRASSEPQQAQEGILLRAAAQGQETPPEQLVRASVGGE